jgi:hypothetical protein
MRRMTRSSYRRERILGDKTEQTLRELEQREVSLMILKLRRTVRHARVAQGQTDHALSRECEISRESS